MSYKNLEIWQLARINVIDIHRMSLELPKFEHFETGQQIRRSSKSVRSNIVEGYGRRYYKQEFIRFLIFAQASNDETLDHLETLMETGSIQQNDNFIRIRDSIIVLGKKLNKFLDAVSQNHVSAK